MSEKSIKKLMAIILSIIIFFQSFGIQMVWLSAFNNNQTNTNYKLENNYLGLNQYPYPLKNVKMIIITNNTEAVHDYANWKIMKGLPVFVASMEDIKANYTSGTMPERIHEFLMDAKSSMDNLTYVLLAGDDYHIPMISIYLPDCSEGWGFSPTLKPTDFYYACLDDATWDDDGDGIFGECSRFNSSGIPIGGPDEIDDWIPDIYLGRVPFASYDDISNFLNLIIDYEKYPLKDILPAEAWKEFLFTGAILNYDEQVNWWEGKDYTDDAELCDYIINQTIPESYTNHNYYENRTYFWDYTPTNDYSNLTRDNIIYSINNYDSNFIHMSAHGSPLGVYNYKDSSGSPYGERKTVDTQGTRITGIKVANADNRGNDDEIVAVTSGGSILVYDGNWEQGWISTLIGFSQASPTCVAVGDCDNDGQNEIAVGAGNGIVVYEYKQGFWALLDNTTLDDPTIGIIQCIDIGPTEEYEYEQEWYNEIAVGDDFGFVYLYVWQLINNNNFDLYPIYLNLAGDPHQFNFVDCIICDDVDQDGSYEVIFGARALPLNGVCALRGMITLPHPGVSWGLSDMWFWDFDFAMCLDSGDPDNDIIQREVVVGTFAANVIMLENWTFQLSPNPLANVVIIDANAGSAVEGIAIGDVDENIPAYEVIAGTINGILRKYIAAPNGLYYTIDGLMQGFGVDSLAVGYIDDDSESTHQEIAVGTQGGIIAQFPIFAYQWPSPYNFDFFFNTTDAAYSSTNIPALTYIDACTTAAFDYAIGDSLAEAMMKSGLSIAYIGSLRATWYYYGLMNVSLTPGSKGGNRAAAWHFWDAFFNNVSDYRAGTSFYKMLQKYYLSYDTGAIGYQDENWHRKNVLSYIFLGDPELQIYTDVPNSFMIGCPSEAPINDTIDMIVENNVGVPVANATVCIKGTNFYYIGKTDNSGFFSFTLSSDKYIPGETIKITVTKYNFAAKTINLNIYGLNNIITVSTPILSQYRVVNDLSIISVIGVCNNTFHGVLNDTNTFSTFYTIYTNTGEDTGITGNLTYNGVVWIALDIDISSLQNGEYYIKCTLSDIDADGISPSSKSFEIFNFLYWVKTHWELMVIILEGVIIAVLIIAIFVIRRKFTR